MYNIKDMGILIISIILLGIAIYLCSKSEWTNLKLWGVSLLFVLSICMPLHLYNNNRGMETYYTRCYIESELLLKSSHMLNRETIDDLTKLKYIYEDVYRVNMRLKSVKRFNERNDFFYGIFKAESFGNFDYLVIE